MSARAGRGHIGPFTIGVALSLVILAGIWLGWTPAAQAVRAWRAEKSAASARAAIAAEDWPNASRLLAEARARDPENAEVIAATVEFLKATKADPGGLAQQLGLLEKHRPLTDEETLLLGRALITSGRTAEARKIYDKLPLSIGTRPAGLQLLAEILAAEGHVKEARLVDSRATARGSAANDPEAVLKQSLQERRSAFPEIRKKGRERLWESAARTDALGLEAISALAADPALTQAEADDLLQLVEKHPLATLSSRLDAVAALARLHPGRAAAIFEQEVEHFKKTGGGKLEEIAVWLMRQHQNELVFRLVPVKLALSSRELYPILMQAMSHAERWNELRDLLSTPNPPVPQSLVDLALADVQARLQPDLRESRRLLEGTVRSAGTEGSIPTLQRAAALAAKLNLQDIAAAAYLQAGIKAAGSSQAEEAMSSLQKSLESALIAKDTATLLEASRRLLDLSPGSAIYADRLAYLRLVLGVEMETVSLPAQPSPATLQTALTVAVERIPLSLLKALAAYRLGDLNGVKDHLATLANASSLPAGQRAVAAGLLALAGKPDRAWEIAEKVPDALLLQEERVFLNHAR